MEVRFKRYKIHHKKKDFYVYIPQDLHNDCWLIDWTDDWFGGCFLTGNFKFLRILVATFALIGFSPYSIVFLPIGHDMIPKSWSANPENGKYDVVFRTNRVPFKPKDWKEIRKKLKKSKWTTYKMKVDEKRIKSYFRKRTKGLEDIPRYKILKKAGTESYLALDTVFFTYPRVIYQQEVIDVLDWINNTLSDEERYLRRNYNEERDSWTCDHMCFCYNRCFRKSTYTKPGCGLNLELYDLEIVNRYKKEKEYLVENAREREKKNKIEGHNQYTYAGTHIMKIVVGK